ncbi:MAG: ATP-binding cassette domain-containing protein [Flavobacteriales bacterium]|nr:ATP-binding cassette domain-containing protein [Flavobacteriales bacterium]MBK7942027.1 ATP-binding cassette domain-containing protein [Flavobacteriales bacterium]MBK9700573.1 ATP-binding cassette domain-containing protein [Flavobacteriales bacterium]
MSEKILNALLQLFAIIARADAAAGSGRPAGRLMLDRFLRQQFTAEQVEEHLARFDAHVAAFHNTGGESRSGRKRISVNSVRVLRICVQVNEELTQRQKFIVLMHLLEFIHAGGVAEQEQEFVNTVAETFNIGREDFERCQAFVAQAAGERVDSPHLLYADAAVENGLAQARHLHAHLDGELRVLHVPNVNLYMVRYLGQDRVLLNGQPMNGRHHYVLSNGSSIRPPHGRPIYYSDILGSFMTGRQRDGLVFKAERITYAFPNGRLGLHELDLAETSGKLVGIMGGSGSGKSTLLNVLNGNLKPSSGHVTINGVDVHSEAARIRGVIGHVSQDDLLIEELSVYQNLFYNAKLCFGDLTDAQIGDRVLKLLQQLGLYDTKDLKVGSPLEKTISGGQRKRLNIALELIREPSVLFVDEPTSGLSSRDSENIMDLLKELALRGRIVFVVIHQPSSDIFKLFDRLLLIDQEGYPVYYGDPVESVVYFKRVTGQVNSEVGQCRACGNVNPEQIFNILEAKLVDEYGMETDQRRISPEAWNEVFKAQMEGRMAQVPEVRSVPRSTFKAPGWLVQLKVFFTRDILAKLANRQYVLINLLEAPVLAFVMAFFLRYHGAGEEGTTYIYRANDNIPQYLFIAVIVSLFLGLTVAAEEIIRDRKILQREKFLALNRNSYLLSKIAILFLISAIQSLLFVVVGDRVLGIQDMGFVHWALLFSTSCFANVLGLNVSASFNSAKVIYIVIPVLIIPQLLFSGIIVRFDKLHPWFSSQQGVPWIGNVMASRWAYEGLAVTQFVDNAYERRFYTLDQRMKTANWKKDLWVRELQHRVTNLRGVEIDPAKLTQRGRDLELLRNELKAEAGRISGLVVPDLRMTPEGHVDQTALNAADGLLNDLTVHYRRMYKEAERAKEQLIAELTDGPEARIRYFALLDAHRNESLAEFVTNKNDVNVIAVDRGALVRKSDPIYLEAQGKGFFGAHFYAPAKWLGGIRVPTFWANVIVLWLMSLAFAIALRAEVFPWIVQRLSSRSGGT